MARRQERSIRPIRRYATLNAERSGAGQSRPASPDEMKSKIDELIAGEIADGKLTDEQAEEL